MDRRNQDLIRVATDDNGVVSLDYYRNARRNGHFLIPPPSEPLYAPLLSKAKRLKRKPAGQVKTDRQRHQEWVNENTKQKPSGQQPPGTYR